MRNPEKHWQLKLASRSLKKKEKVEQILSFVHFDREYKYLEIGCEKGVLSYYLRKQGGDWYHSDIDEENVRVTKLLLKEKVFLVDPKKLNFYDHTFDGILAVDILEHVEEDELFLKEMKRILKPEGHLYITVPKSSKGPVLDWVERKIGIKPAFYGHVRAGYTFSELKEKLERFKMRIINCDSYSGFVTELFELLLNAGYVKLSPKKRQKGTKGGISPATSAEFKKNRKLFKIYSFIYPFLFLFSRLDYLFQTGYVLIIEAENKAIT